MIINYDSEEIEDEIKSKLVWLVPEPCWEDHPFEFLREFLSKLTLISSQLFSRLEIWMNPSK
ncbi:MAG: hypothetical protein PT120_20110 [Aphanizomenon gracile PMC649.10]|jgi:hypothetical protein|nr:hypothetical protein [Aphanizomenon gracile PMC627.10]MDM3857124.1 hypothetical protein [Aphanizomenon gracile PMC649.10]